MMYYKFYFDKNTDIGELCHHLEMNGYDFDRVGQTIYVSEEERAYVITCMEDRNLEWWED